MNAKLSAALAAAIWGTTYIVVTTALPHNPVFTGAVRALGGGLPLLLFYRALPQPAWWLKIFILGTLNCGLFFAFLFVAAERLPGGVAGTLQSLGPLFTILMAWPLLGESPSMTRLISVAAGAFGVTLLLLNGNAGLDLTGAAAGIGAALSVALGGVLLHRWRRPAPLLVFTAWQLVVGGLELAILATFLHDVPSTLTGINLLGYTCLALIGTTLAFVLWFHGIEGAGISAVAPFFLLVPIVAFALDVVVRGFVPTPIQGLGAAIVLASLMFGQGRARAAPSR